MSLLIEQDRVRAGEIIRELYNKTECSIGLQVDAGSMLQNLLSVIAALESTIAEQKRTIETLNCALDAKITICGDEKITELKRTILDMEAREKMYVDILKRASTSLSAFCSDEGWTQEDMDTMDAVDATLNAKTNPSKEPKTANPLWCLYAISLIRSN